MHRILVALATSVSIIGAATLPAAAESPFIQPYSGGARPFNVGTEEVIGGLLALGLLAAIIDGQRDREPDVIYKTPPRRPHANPVRPVKPVAPRATNNRVLPRSCFRVIERGKAKLNVLGQRCLHRNYRHAGSLPRTCIVRVQTKDGVYAGYRPSCLNDRGYTLTSR